MINNIDIIKLIFTNFTLICGGMILTMMPILNQQIIILQVFVISIILTILTFKEIFRKGNNFKVLNVFLVGYLICVLVWPWPPHRFLIPVLPFLAAFFIEAIWNLIKKIPILAKHNLLPLALVFFMILTNFFDLYKISQLNKASNYPHSSTLKTADQPIHWTSFQSIFEWIKINTQHNDVFACGLDSMIYLYTNRPAFRPFVMNPGVLFYGAKNNKDMIYEMDRFFKIYQARYLVQLPMVGFSEEKPFHELLKEAQKKYPGWLTPVFQGEDARFLIYRIEPQFSPINQH